MEPIQILELIKEDIRDKFDGDPLMMRTMNLVITEYKARSERLHKLGVSGKRPLIAEILDNHRHFELTYDEAIDRILAACANAKGEERKE